MTRTSTTIGLDVRDRVAWITLDGPDTRNALDRTSVQSFVDACDVIDADLSVAVAVVTGKGPAFCSGADRSTLDGLRYERADSVHERLDEFYRAFRRFGELRVPTVAAVNGAAVGAGLNLALAADIRIAAADAVLTPGFAENGIHPGGGHLHLLSVAAGRQTAAALGVFGQPISAQRAAELGVVWRVVPRAELSAATERLVEPVARDPELARALAASLRLTTTGTTTWPVAVEVERTRQIWSITRQGKKGTA